MMSMWLVLVTLLLAAALYLNWLFKVGFHFGQWSSDGKNFWIFLKSAQHPELFSRDFPFAQRGIADFYMPSVQSFLLFFFRRVSDPRRVVLALQFISGVVLFSGWFVLGYEVSHSVIVSLSFLALTVPDVATITGDSLGAGFPGNWTPRFWANAITPWFVVALWMASGGEASAVFVSGILAVLLLIVHPTSGIGALLFFGTMLFRLQVPPDVRLLMLAAVGVIGLLIAYRFRGLFFQGSSDRIARERSGELNEAFLERIAIWPYDSQSPLRPPGSFIGILFGASGQALWAGALVMIWLWSFYSGVFDIAESFFLPCLSLLTVFLFFDRTILFGLGVFLISITGLAGLTELSSILLVGVIWIGGLLVVCKPTTRKYAALVVILASSGLLAFGSASSHATLFQKVLTSSVTELYLVYFIGCIAFHWFLPKFFARTISFVDWGRIIKTAFIPLYYYALLTLCDAQQMLLSPSCSSTERILNILLLLFPFAFAGYALVCFEGNQLTNESEAIISWLKENTSIDALIHVVSSHPPYQSSFFVESSTLSFDVRACALRSITGSWKDGGITFYISQKLFQEWRTRMLRIRSCIENKNGKDIIEHAKSLGADFLIVSKNLIPVSHELWNSIEKEFELHVVARVGLNK